MKVLLIQFRPDPAVADHEFDCYVKFTGLAAEQITRLNVFEQLPNVGNLAGFDVLVVGGSGDVHVSANNEPEKIAAVVSLLKAARMKGMPILGACFGGQIMCKAFGGVVEMDKENEEVGTTTVTKTPEAGKCPVFSSLPDTFDVQIGHKDHLTVLPPGAVNLAWTSKSQHQAFTIPGEPIYGFVFHPELDEKAVQYRINYYAEAYGWTQEFRNELFAGMRPSPYAVEILRLFFEKIVKEKQVFPTS